MRRIAWDKEKGQNPYFSMDFGLSCPPLDEILVEAAATKQES